MADDKSLEESEEFVSLDDELEDIEEILDEVEIANTPTKEKSNKTIYLLISALAILTLIILSTLYYIYTKKEERKEEQNATKSIIKDIKRADKKTTTNNDSNLSYKKLLKRANELEKMGKKDEALKIREEISSFNKSLSIYNMAVTKLKEGSLNKAIELFKRSSKEPKLEFESYLNIAISAYKLKDAKDYSKYLNLAKSLLISKKNSPLYGYYRSLIDYYRGYFAEALVPLNNDNSPYYKDIKNHLNAKLLTLVQNTKSAIKVLESKEKTQDLFTLAILYAKQNDLEVSKKYLDKSIQNSIFPLNASIVKALLDIKTGMLKDASTNLNRAIKSDSNQSKRLYPIKPILKRSLFDPEYAQKNFSHNIFSNPIERFSLIIYYAPYKIIDPKNSIGNINRAVSNIYINQLPSAIKELKSAKNQSSANLFLIDGVKKTINGDLYKAIDIFKEGLKSYPNSSELHYDLALNLAKMYRFDEALSEFKKAQILDQNNYLASIFINFCSQILYKDDNYLNKLNDNLNNLNISQLDTKRAKALISIARGDLDNSGLDLNETLFDTIIAVEKAKLLDKSSLYKEKTKELFNKDKNDLIAQILYIDANENIDDIKEYAKVIQNRLLNKKLNIKSLKDGVAVKRELFVKILSIAGVVPNFIEQFQTINDLNTLDIGTLQTLAYANIYAKNFNTSYNIYNILTQKYNLQDSHTLFLGAVAAIGDKKYANAIALLELAKLTNEKNMESRFALGLLYHENKNLKAASIQYKKIGDIGFNSRYFDFELAK